MLGIGRLEYAYEDSCLQPYPSLLLSQPPPSESPSPASHKNICSAFLFIIFLYNKNITERAQGSACQRGGLGCCGLE